MTRAFADYMVRVSHDAFCEPARPPNSLTHGPWGR